MDSFINHKVFRLSILMYSLFLPFTPTSALSAGEKVQENRIERKKFLQKPTNENHINKVTVAERKRFLQKPANENHINKVTVTEGKRFLQKPANENHINKVTVTEGKRFLQKPANENHINKVTVTERKRFLQKPANENNANKARDNQEAIDQKVGAITQGIHKIGDILSSSPSQLTEQAKSYALGKINGAINTEAQKWLTRFGTGRINFSIDKKGKLDASSLDVLVPLYDNKADWLFFSQLGYRRHDSRNTLNLGFGGRYFTPKWMYGLNTFFDKDFTGQHQRLGVGGEIWTDYVKLSANTYWRLSKWRISPNELDYEERPANGYDINGEFFLPAYPNLGGKLGYEQYFGDNVALFNRETKQKNPNLARIGLNYTPIPLMTMGVDYKFGSGHSETLFQANLNYRFGIPFGDQISPRSVAAIRTLAGSRYELVERNNHIVLDYKKKPEFNLALPNTLSGYSAQHVQITPNITAEHRLKKISWQTNEEFRKNGGAITPYGSSVELDLPKYSVKGINSYTLSAISEITGSNKPMTTYMDVVVEPFAIKEQSIKPSGTGPVISNGKPAYDLAATITYGNKNNPPIKNQVIPNVKWSIEPENKHAILNWDSAGTTNDNGQLTATLSSTQPLDPKTKIYLSMDAQPKLEIKGDKPLNLTHLGDAIQAKDFVFDQKAPYEATEQKPVIVTATVFDLDGNPINKKMEMNLQWSTVPSDLPGLSVTPAPGYENTSDEEGKIKAIVTSTQRVKGAKVGVLINEKHQSFSEPFNFVTPESLKFAFDAISQSPMRPLIANGKDRYTYKVRVIDTESKLPLKNQSLGKIKAEKKTVISNLLNVPDEVKLEIPANPTTDAEGYLTLYMTSLVGMDGIYFKLLQDTPYEDDANSIQSEPVNFDTVPIPVGILMGTENSPKTKYISQQGRPYNVHKDLIVQLTQDGKTNLFDGTNIPRPNGGSAGLSGSDIRSSNPNLVKVDRNTGNITFLLDNFSIEQWPVTVTLTKTVSDTGITSSYYYTFNPRRYILIPEHPDPLAPNSNTVPLGNYPECSYLNGNNNSGLNNQQAVAPTLTDMGATPQTTTPTSISYEYDKEHFPYFGLKALLNNSTGVNILKTYTPSDETIYAYDYLKRIIEPATIYPLNKPSLLLCIIRVGSYGEVSPN
ncbi:inverse autotransporter beta-barrel domain-containing protein [Xenorhabdus sp. GDc328]|uniref:inverse autotransporter beta domain-containing protein n=1 Tax=Xenorhabdus sp. GDc328 TaxID=742178 RepID=UPI0006AA353F|nr:inverse autotransporter beta-barrel domain-containing protein [Xenorhabdus sp. GDc328]